MHISTKCSIAIQCLIFIHEYGEDKRVTRELVSLSTGCNPVSIRNIMSALKKNGILVYATCSPEPVETDKVVKKFLEAHPDFEQVGLPVRISKNEFGLDRFFAAALRKK